MFFPINTRAIGEILAGYISESIKSDMEYEEKRRKEKQEKEHAKIMERIKKEDEDNRRFHNLLRFGSREEIEGYFQRTWMFDHFDYDKLCTYNPYGNREWKRYYVGGFCD